MVKFYLGAAQGPSRARASTTPSSAWRTSRCRSSRRARGRVGDRDLEAGAARAADGAARRIRLGALLALPGDVRARRADARPRLHGVRGRSVLAASDDHGRLRRIEVTRGAQRPSVREPARGAGDARPPARRTAAARRDQPVVDPPAKDAEGSHEQALAAAHGTPPSASGSIAAPSSRPARRPPAALGGRRPRAAATPAGRRARAACSSAADALERARRARALPPRRHERRPRGRAGGRRASFRPTSSSDEVPVWDDAEQGPWRLEIGGMVRRPVRLTLAELKEPAAHRAPPRALLRRGLVGGRGANRRSLERARAPRRRVARRALRRLRVLRRRLPRELGHRQRAPRADADRLRPGRPPPRSRLRRARRASTRPSSSATSARST